MFSGKLMFVFSLVSCFFCVVPRRYNVKNWSDRFFVPTLSNQRRLEVNAIPPLNKNCAFYQAVSRGDILEVERMMSDSEVDPAFYDNFALDEAERRNHSEIVSMLLEDPRVVVTEVLNSMDWPGRNEVALDHVCRPSFDPSSFDNVLIRKAAEMELIELVARLLSDQRVDPSSWDNYALRVSAPKGYLEIVRLLLVNSKVNPSAMDNWALNGAAENGHVEIVDCILRHPRFDPSRLLNGYAMELAAANGHLNVVERLLKDQRIDPCLNDNVAMVQASRNGHLEIVKAIMRSSRFNTINLNQARLAAEMNGHDEIVELFQ